jgi:hypothetical protein
VHRDNSLHSSPLPSLSRVNSRTDRRLPDHRRKTKRESERAPNLSVPALTASLSILSFFLYLSFSTLGRSRSTQPGSRGSRTPLLVLISLFYINNFYSIRPESSCASCVTTTRSLPLSFLWCLGHHHSFTLQNRTTFVYISHVYMQGDPADFIPAIHIRAMCEW